MQDRRQLFGYVGAGLLALSVFLPIVSLPIVGSINYIQGDGLFVLLFAVAAGVLVAMKKYKLVIIPTGLALVLVSFALINFVTKINEIKASMDGVSGGLFGGLAEGLFNSVQLQWGWFVMYLGIGALAFSVFGKFGTPPAPPAE